MIQGEVLFQVLDALDALEIPYVITGSYASNYWGRPRATHDADLVVEISPLKAAALAKRLEGEFYAPDFVLQEAAEHGGHANVIHMQQAFKVDLWMRQDTPYDRERFARRRSGTMFGRRVWVLGAEDTVLSKLLWYRASPVSQRQLQDAVEVYEIQEAHLDQAYLERWATALGLSDLLTQVRAQAAPPPYDGLTESA